MILVKFVAFGCLLKIIVGESITPEAPENEIATKYSTYKAAVVEFNIRPKMSGKQKIDENFGRVTEIILSNHQKNLDILVFPEYILNDVDAPVYIPELPPHQSLCNMMTDISQQLQNISCAVQRSSVYVVINLILVDKVRDLYNTAIVFDRNGAIIARYRKYNLFNEKISRPSTPDLITFHTDFNVTFGIFICFDILFEEPAMALVRKGIKNFIFPSSWYSELPYMTALQSQHSWAYANNVNLLAANRNCPSEGSSGSGIYAGRFGALKTFISEEEQNGILIADVPSDSKHTDGGKDEQETIELFRSDNQIVSTDDELTLFQEDLGKFSIAFLEPNRSSKSKCKDNVCCKFDILIDDQGERVDKKFYYHYAIAVTNDYRKCGCGYDLQASQSICSIVACTERNDEKSCGKRFSPNVTVYQRFAFTTLYIEAELPENNFVAMPNSLTDDLTPLESFTFEKSKFEHDWCRVAVNLTESKSNILTFGIYIRNYRNDIASNGGTRSTASIVLAVCCCLNFIFVYKYW